MIGCVTAVKLREWRGVKPVAGPAGVAITTRLRTTPDDEHVLDLVAEHLGRLRRADLAAVTRPQRLDSAGDGEAKRHARRDRLNTRKKALTAESSARWANAIIAANDDQYRLARDAQHRHIVGLRVAIATIEKRLAQPAADTLTPEQLRARKRAKLSKGYPSQAERFAKQRRLQVLRAELGRVTADRHSHRAHVVEGGKRLAKTRHHPPAAELTVSEWRQRWDCARYRIEANGSGDEPFGNLTITVTPHGEVSLRLPRPLQHLANAPHGRYVLSGSAVFSYRADEWRARITGGKSVSFTRKPGRAGRYLTAAWACPPTTSDTICVQSPGGDVRADGPVLAVDLTTDTLPCDASTRTATRSVHQRPSTSTSPAPAPAAMPRSGTRSPGSSTTPCATASTPSLLRTSTSPTPAPWAARQWDEASAANASAERWPVSPPRCSATGCPRRPTDTASACTRSTPPTPAHGGTSTGARHMRTSPDTRQPPP